MLLQMISIRAGEVTILWQGVAYTQVSNMPFLNQSKEAAVCPCHRHYHGFKALYCSFDTARFEVLAQRQVHDAHTAKSVSELVHLVTSKVNYVKIFQNTVLCKFIHLAKVYS